MYILNIGVSITLKGDFSNKYLVYEKQFQTLFCYKIIKRLLFIFTKDLWKRHLQLIAQRLMPQVYVVVFYDAI